MQGVRCLNFNKSIRPGLNVKPIYSRTVINQTGPKFINVRFFADHPDPKPASIYAKTRSLCKSVGLVGNSIQTVKLTD